MRFKSRSLAVLVATALVAVGVVNVASASAATQHWYVGGTKVAEGTSTKITVTLPLPPRLPFTGIDYRQSDGLGGWQTSHCSKATSTNFTIENPKGGGAGTAAGVIALYGCNGICVSMSLNGLLGGATEFESKPALKLSFAGGQSGYQGSCTGVGNLTGSFTGVSEAATSSLSFTEASTSEFAHIAAGGATAARLNGRLLLEGAGGQSVYLAP